MKLNVIIYRMVEFDFQEISRYQLCTFNLTQVFQEDTRKLVLPLKAKQTSMAYASVTPHGQKTIKFNHILKYST